MECCIEGPASRGTKRLVRCHYCAYGSRLWSGDQGNVCECHGGGGCCVFGWFGAVCGFGVVRDGICGCGNGEG